MERKSRQRVGWGKKNRSQSEVGQSGGAGSGLEALRVFRPRRHLLAGGVGGHFRAIGANRYSRPPQYEGSLAGAYGGQCRWSASV